MAGMVMQRSQFIWNGGVRALALVITAGLAGCSPQGPDGGGGGPGLVLVSAGDRR